MRETPFSEILEDAIKSSILAGYRPLIPQSISDDPKYTTYIQLMQLCWSQHPEDRPSMLTVYQDLMTIIETDPTTHFLKDLLPAVQSLGGDQEEFVLPRQPFQVQPIDIPFAPLQVTSKDELPHITCMIAPYKNEEFWFGFDNGVVSHARYEEQSMTLDVLACQEHEQHPSRVTVMIYCIGQGEYGTIWSGSEGGVLSVWSSQREECGNISASASFKSHFLIYSGKKQNPLYVSTALKRTLTRKKSSRSNHYWVEFEYGTISFYSAQSKVKPKIRLSLENDVTDIRYQSETRLIFLSHKTGDKLFILASEDERSSPEEYYRIIATAFSASHSESPLKLKRLTFRQFFSQDKIQKVGIQSLLAVDHTVFCATHDFFISEWRLSSTADAHGLHETYFLESLRSFQLDVSEIKPRLRVILGFVRVNSRTLWFAVGNRWIVFDLDSPSQSLSKTTVPTSPLTSSMMFVGSSVCSSNDDEKMISLLLVRRTHFDQVYTGDESGRMIVWHPEPAPLSDSSQTTPLLVPIEHHILNLIQSNLSLSLIHISEPTRRS